MILILLKIVALLVFMIAPLAGPQKRKRNLFIDTDVTNAHYAIDTNGCLVRIHGRELSKYEL